jgi:hypothetical protein
MIKNLLKWYEEKFKKEPIVVLIITIVVIISATGSFLSGLEKIDEVRNLVYDKYFTDKYASDYQKIDKLSLGLSIDYVTELFGAPKAVRVSNTYDGYKEHYYVNDCYLLHAITDEQGELRIYGITTTKEDFHPNFPMYGYNSLGNLKMSDISDYTSNNTFSRLSSKYFSYSEIFYFGNPGYYNHYAVGYNQFGVEYDEDTISGMIPYLMEINSNYASDDEYNKIRADFIPNTFCVIGDEFDINEFEDFIIGFPYLSTRDFVNTTF